MSRFPVEYADQRLEALTQALWDDKPIGMFERDWLLSGVLVALREGRTLDEALGLGGPGRSVLRERVLLLQRDEQLCLALDAVGVGAAATNWERCRRLAPLARQFMDRQWPHVRVLPEPLADWPEWKRRVFMAAQLDPALACSAWTLSRAIARVRGVSCNAKRGTISLNRCI